MAEISSILSRRGVLAGLTAGGVAAGAVPLFSDLEAFKELLRPTAQGSRGVPLASATHGDWNLQVGSKFTAETGHVLELVDVQTFPLQSMPANLRQRAFLARFDVREGGPMRPDTTYRVAHKEGGNFDMHLTAGGPDKPLRMLAVYS